MFQWQRITKPILRSVICFRYLSASSYDIRFSMVPLTFSDCFIFLFSFASNPFSARTLFRWHIKAFSARRSVKRHSIWMFYMCLVFYALWLSLVQRRNGTDINKWCVVDASLKNPFSITSIHWYNCHWIKCASVLYKRKPNISQNSIELFQVTSAVAEWKLYTFLSDFSGNDLWSNSPLRI